MAYANLDNLLTDYLPDAKSTAERGAVGRILDNVSAFVDSYCRRADNYFSPSPEESSVKRVRGEGELFLRLPRHVFGSVEEVKTTYSSVIDASRYYESEKNGWLYAEESGIYPEASFDLLTQESWQTGQIFLVTARWGYETTPPDVQEAVRLLVARLYGTQRGTLGQISVEGFLRERLLPSAALQILDKYKKREFEI